MLGEAAAAPAHRLGPGCGGLLHPHRRWMTFHALPEPEVAGHISGVLPFCVGTAVVQITGRNSHSLFCF